MLTNRPTVNVVLATDKKRPDGTMPYFILVTWRGRAKEKTNYNGTTKTGSSAVILDPDGEATRAQVATILMRFLTAAQ